MTPKVFKSVGCRRSRQLWFIDRGQRLGTSFSSFTDRWFQKVVVGDDRNAVNLVPFDHSQGEIH
ncbi:hypothetical protein ACT453_54940, partial [Bacillus sp. D-CC]